jgi:hypothetical protein
MPGCVATRAATVVLSFWAWSGMTRCSLVVMQGIQGSEVLSPCGAEYWLYRALSGLTRRPLAVTQHSRVLLLYGAECSLYRAASGMTRRSLAVMHLRGTLAIPNIVEFQIFSPIIKFR